MRSPSRTLNAGTAGRTRRAILAATGGALLAACSPAGMFGGAKPLESRAPALLDFWGGPNAREREDQTRAWNARYPHLRVTFRTSAAVGAGAEALRSFAAAVAARVAPQVIDFDRFQVAAFANWRLLRTLDDLAKRDKLDLSRFVPAALGEATGLDKRLYGLPSSVDARLLYWRKDLFAQAGLDPERPPTTWEEFKAAAVRLGRGGPDGLERAGFHTEVGQASLHLFAWQNGGGFQTPDGKTATLTLPANQQALEWQADLMAAQGPWAQISALRNRWGDEDGHPFLTGELPMVYEIDGWAADKIGRYRPDLPFGVAPPPLKQAGGTPSTWSGGYSYVQTHNAKDPDVAWELIKWLTGPEAVGVAHEGAAQRARAGGGRYLPGMTGQIDLDQRQATTYRTGLPALDAVPGAAAAALRNTRFREPSVAASDLWEEVLGAQRDAVSQQKSAAQALAERNIRVQRALDQAWTFVKT
jgi:ABC-type glycerol-3-phosphate transport system substrate-binding protein